MASSLSFEIEPDEIETFLQDVNEHLQVMESGILRLEQAMDPGTLNAVFRAAHTLKATAGAVGHRNMAELTHAMETLFDAMREARLSFTSGMADELLATVDALKSLRDEVVSRQPSGVDVAPLLTRLRESVSLRRRVAPEATSAQWDEMASPPSAARNDKSTWEKTDDEGQVSAQVKAYREQGYAIFEIQVAVAADAFAPAARLLQAAVALGQGGQIIAQRPSQDELLNDQHDGRLWLILATRTSADAVEDLLGNVSDLAGFRVQPYATEAPVRSPVKDGSASSFESLRVPTSETVRISVERLDNLMNLVGELVTDRTRLVQIEAMLRARYGKGGDIGTLDETLSHLGQITNQLQEEVMRARLLPISQLFDRFPRMVRDVARAADKQVDLVIEGETTELDRSIIEAIGDPLVHLLRNAVDHGIESPQARVSAGKPPTGSVRLTAAHAEGQIVITVQDDGRGIDPEQTRRAAVRHGLISEDEAACLDDEEAIALIFRPGLSTAEQITGVSGRGVGLDVVRTNINQVGGSVVVENQVGRGVTFRVTLPLTLAILPTMLVALGEDVYAIPLTSIVESLYLSDVTVSSVRASPAIQWRNQVLPLLHLRQFFDGGLRTPALPQRLERRAGASAVDSSSTIQASKSEIQNPKSAIVAVTWGKLQAGLVVDRIIGKQEIVVKPFGSLIGSVPGLSGCTILGNGRIALIVDVPGLINAALQARNQKTR